MREAGRYYQEATEVAWQRIQDKLQILKHKLGIRTLKLEGLAYDGDSYANLIDELPDGPKSGHPEHVEVHVGITAVFRVLD